MEKKYLIYSFVGIIVISVIIFLSVVNIKSSNNNNYDELNKYSTYSDASKINIKIYKSMNCGCCGIYSEYVQDKSGFNVEITGVEDVTEIKDKNKVPTEVRSCHTSIIGNYFIEGHVPIEAINKLLIEKPDILGIALPGMPSGAPGMPGGKDENFVILQINKDGSTEEFMKL